MLYIVTPVFNRKKFTKNYLLALEKQTNKNFKTIIVDDGSTDGTSEMIEKEFPDVILLKEQGDLWWTEATNIGVRYAMKNNATAIMTLNDDTIPYDNYVEKMIYWANRKPNALLGAFAIDHMTGRPVPTGETYNWKDGKSTILLDTIKEIDYNGLHKINLFPGRGLLIPVDVFKNIGLYDSKNFPQTVADRDFVFRANNYGYEIYCNHDARIDIFVEESAVQFFVRNKSLKNYYNHLFSFRGGGNLKYFIKVTMKNCPKKYLLQRLFTGVGSRLISYWWI